MAANAARAGVCSKGHTRPPSRIPAMFSSVKFTSLRGSWHVWVAAATARKAAQHQCRTMARCWTFASRLRCPPARPPGPPTTP
eukprot:8098229-Alexandrium_andersonii.AAC.1